MISCPFFIPWAPDAVNKVLGEIHILEKRTAKCRRKEDLVSRKIDRICHDRAVPDLHLQEKLCRYVRRKSALKRRGRLLSHKVRARYGRLPVPYLTYLLYLIKEELCRRGYHDLSRRLF